MKGSITIESSSFDRPTDVNDAPQLLLSIETFGSWGLIVVTFENETHLFAQTKKSGIHRIHPIPKTPVHAVETELLGRILPDCAKISRGETRILKEQLLTLSGHRAVAMADFIQQVRISLSNIFMLQGVNVPFLTQHLWYAPRSEVIDRKTLVGLLQDICSVSRQLPTAYWVTDVAIGRFYRNGGEAIISEAMYKGQEVLVREVWHEGVVSPSARDDGETGEMLSRLAVSSSITLSTPKLPQILKLLDHRLFVEKLSSTCNSAHAHTLTSLDSSGYIMMTDTRYIWSFLASNLVYSLGLTETEHYFGVS